MSIDCFYKVIELIPLDANASKFFGFSEFIAGLALMMLAWTIADVRYRFRVKTAPIPLQGITFVIVVIIGTLTLLTDLWRAEEWFVPKGNLITPAEWQATLGGLFLITFLTWSWFAFIKPPVYGKFNAKRYAQTLYRAILKGSPSELPVIADELSHSAKTLIHFATNIDKYAHINIKSNESQLKNPPNVTAYANDILLLIADKKLCRAIVEFSPNTALAFFHAIGKTKKYGVQISVFGKNIVHEALTNKDSFLFHETHGYQSGLLGYHKPLSQAIFGNYTLVEEVGSLLDLPLTEKKKWDASQWEAYCRIVLTTLRSYSVSNLGQHSYSLYRAKDHIEHAIFDLYKINDISNDVLDSDIYKRFVVIVRFIKDAIKILNEKNIPKYIHLRVKKPNNTRTIYDHLAETIFEIFLSASEVSSSPSICWIIQHNSAWSEFFNFNTGEGKSTKLILYKVRRLLYNEIKEMNSFPNFKGARSLKFCLYVMGFQLQDIKHSRESIALHKVILSWTKENFAWLYLHTPLVAEACLVENITYDEKNFKLARAPHITGLQRKPKISYFDINPPTAEQLKQIKALKTTT